MALTIVVVSCFVLSCQSGKMIHSEGIHYAKCGQAMPEKGTEIIGGLPATDTFYEDEGHRWRALIVEHNHGNVILEEDFYDHETLNRIRIETPDFRLRSGLKVGLTIADMGKKTGQWYISGMPRFASYDFYSEEFPRIHFVIPEDGKEREPDTLGYRFSDFDPGLKIVAIVIF